MIMSHVAAHASSAYPPHRPGDDQQALMMHNPDHMRWLLSLASELLPPLPTTGVYAPPPVDPRLQGSTYLVSLMRGRPHIPQPPAVPAERM